MITTRLIGKDTLRYCFVLIAVCVAFLSLCIRTASAEVIISFNSDITVEDNGDIVVTETIAYDFQGASKHGIIRNIKSKHAERAGVWYKEKYVDFEVVSVRKDGKSEPYTIEAYDGLLLKIGNPNLTSTGSHIYQIMYQAKGALASSEAGVELYWNVTGNEWPVNIEKTSATVRRVGSGSLLEAQSCYSGFTGTNTACPDKKVIANVATFNGGAIKPGSEFTVAQALTLSVPPQSLERVNWGLIKLVGVTAWFILLTFLVVRWRF